MARAADRSHSESMTITVQQPSSLPSAAQVVNLRLRRRKKVTWKEGTIDNEYLNKRSSKKCCIFHKEKPFDEDGSDDEGNHDEHCDHAGTDSGGQSQSSNGHV
ncbi:hypothetical protein KP509_10G025200 [Ceratopteris richardii]|uniref:Uncharacterized protein n=1 Tax=Ceratopteris richardii TaxID=49495 RepID=A0A8T2TZK4_CERRI|nr:hypothetical protein KP509_10G025200 [Ceratopteris richardii]